MTEFTIKDSGERVEYPSGMKRDIQDDKIDYTIIPIWFLNDMARLLQAGAKKYGRNNWQLANSQEEWERFRASGLRHHFNHLDGQDDEPHNYMAIFNFMAEENCKRNMEKDTLKHKLPSFQVSEEIFNAGFGEPHPSTSWVDRKGFLYRNVGNKDSWWWRYDLNNKCVECVVKDWNTIPAENFPMTRVYLKGK